MDYHLSPSKCENGAKKRQKRGVWWLCCNAGIDNRYRTPSIWRPTASLIVLRGRDDKEYIRGQKSGLERKYEACVDLECSDGLMNGQIRECFTFEGFG